MKTFLPISCILGLLWTLPAAGAAPEIWVGTIPAHTIACSATPVDSSDPAAVDKAGQEFLALWPEERLLDLGAVFGRPAESEGAIVVCAQYFGSAAPLPGGLILQQVPESPGLFTYCGGDAAAAACLPRLNGLLGEAWRGERWSRTRLDWVKPGAVPPASVPPHADLESLAASSDTLRTPPDDESDLLPVGHVAVARLTAEDADRIRTELSRPPEAPAPATPSENP